MKFVRGLIISMLLLAVLIPSVLADSIFLPRITLGVFPQPSPTIEVMAEEFRFILRGDFLNGWNLDNNFRFNISFDRGDIALSKCLEVFGLNQKQRGDWKRFWGQNITGYSYYQSGRLSTILFVFDVPQDQLPTLKRGDFIELEVLPSHIN